MNLFGLPDVLIYKIAEGADKDELLISDQRPNDPLRDDVHKRDNTDIESLIGFIEIDLMVQIGYRNAFEITQIFFQQCQLEFAENGNLYVQIGWIFDFGVFMVFLSFRLNFDIHHFVDEFENFIEIYKFFDFDFLLNFHRNIAFDFLFSIFLRLLGFRRFFSNFELILTILLDK